MEIDEILVDDLIEFFAKTPMPWMQSNPYLQRLGQARDQHRRKPAPDDNGEAIRQPKKALP